MAAGGSGIESAHAAEISQQNQRPEAGSDPLSFHRNQAESVLTDAFRSGSDQSTRLQDALHKIDLLQKIAPDPSAKQFFSDVLEMLQKTDLSQLNSRTAIQQWLQKQLPNHHQNTPAAAAAFNPQNPFAAKPIQNKKESNNTIQHHKKNQNIPHLEDQGVLKIIKKIKQLFS